jgi:lipoprotein-anchoring transpeptidase ErfK/SrfK
MVRVPRFLLTFLALLAAMLAVPVATGSPASAAQPIYATPSQGYYVYLPGYERQRAVQPRQLKRQRLAKQRQIQQRQLASTQRKARVAQERRRVAAQAQYRQEMRRKARIARQTEARRVARAPIAERGVDPEFRVGAARQRMAPAAQPRRVAALGDIRAVREQAAAASHVEARIDIRSQRMIVKVDGEVRHVWRVSTGRQGFATPRGTYRPGRMHVSYFSRKYYNSPMPYSIFFRGGYAIHGTTAINRLGGVASHGCVRLATGNARALFNLVRQAGASRTRIVIT